MVAKKTPTKKPKSTPKMASISSDKEWQAQSDARTLKDAHAIRNDPTRLSAAQTHAMKEMEALKQIQRIKGSN